MLIKFYNYNIDIKNNIFLKKHIIIINKFIKLKIRNFIFLKWGLGIGDWGLGIAPNPQSPIPNPQSPIPKKFCIKI